MMVDGRGRPDVAHWVMEISVGVDAGWVVMRARSRSCWSKCGIRERLRKAARERAEKVYSWERVTDRYEEILKKIWRRS